MDLKKIVPRVVRRDDTNKDRAAQRVSGTYAGQLVAISIFSGYS